MNKTVAEGEALMKDRAKSAMQYGNPSVRAKVNEVSTGPLDNKLREDMRAMMNQMAQFLSGKTNATTFACGICKSSAHPTD